MIVKILPGKPYDVLKSVLSTKLAGAPVAPFIAKYSHGGLFGIYAVGAAAETSKLLADAVAVLKTVAGGSVSVDAAKTQVVIMFKSYVMLLGSCCICRFRWISQ